MDIKNISLFLFRTALSLMMLTHAYKKILNLDKMLLGFDPISLGPEISVALVLFSELLCSIFLILGVFNRLSLIPLIVTMVIASLTHLGDPFSKLELPLMYLAGYLLLAVIGLGSIRVKVFDSLENFIFQIVVRKFQK